MGYNLQKNKNIQNKIKEIKSKNINLDQIKENNFIELPSKGKLMIVTDLHGNLKDYEKYKETWGGEDPDSH